MDCGGEIVDGRRQTRGERGQRVAAAQDPAQGRDLVGGAQPAELRQQAPRQQLVVRFAESGADERDRAILEVARQAFGPGDVPSGKRVTGCGRKLARLVAQHIVREPMPQLRQAGAVQAEGPFAGLFDDEGFERLEKQPRRTAQLGGLDAAQFVEDGGGIGATGALELMPQPRSRLRAQRQQILPQANRIARVRHPAPFCRWNSYPRPGEKTVKDTGPLTPV